MERCQPALRAAARPRVGLSEKQSQESALARAQTFKSLEIYEIVTDHTNDERPREILRDILAFTGGPHCVHLSCGRS